MTCWQLISSGAPLLQILTIYFQQFNNSSISTTIQQFSGVLSVTRDTLNISEALLVCDVAVERNRQIVKVAGDVEAELNHYALHLSEKSNFISAGNLKCNVSHYVSITCIE